MSKYSSNSDPDRVIVAMAITLARRIAPEEPPRIRDILSACASLLEVWLLRPDWVTQHGIDEANEQMSRMIDEWTARQEAKKVQEHVS